MKVRLVYKFFVAFLLTALMIVALLIAAVQFFVYRNFSEYIAKAELEKLDHLEKAIRGEYLAHGGWDRLRSHPHTWTAMVVSSLPQDHGISASEGAPVPPIGRPPDMAAPAPSDGQRGFRRPPPPFGRPANRNAPAPSDERRDFRGPTPPFGRPANRNAPAPSDGRRDFREPAPPFKRPTNVVDPMQIGNRLCLFDAQMHPVAGDAKSDTGHILREITAEGLTIGWLGLHISNQFYHPLDIHYIKGQNKAFYLIGTTILALALLISFLLSKHLLEPVRRLTEGTKALAAFKFDTRTDVRTNDELGQLASDFNRMAETLQKYEQMRTQWITDISHELRTPLSVLRGEIEAMQDGIREMTPVTLDSLHSEVLRLGKLVNDLHQLSLSDTRNLYMEKKPVNPLTVLTDTLHLLEGRFEQRKIVIQTDIDPTAPVLLMGDANRLSQLFVNLMENALRYTDSPGVLEIRSEITGECLVLYIEDSPPGVPDDALERIFDRLYRVDKSRSREMGGSGLGLSICRQIVESHGGTIRADHAKAGGLAIIMEFPVIASEL